MLIYKGELKPISRTLRKNMTDAERKLWSVICANKLEGYHFTRQKIIGNYIVDFYCYKAKLVIEVDGSQHYTDKGLGKDKIRDKFLQDNGLKVLRFNDYDVLTNLEGVVYSILQNLCSI
ncbi:MAG TPA: DUF559 domain-containing protein [Dehalococcoidales bacterium]|nr:DUF559 domain-containing protein [Dehalococcoidales bacterium]